MLVTFCSGQADDRAHTDALVSTVLLLRRWGYRTLCVDWDLTPGRSALLEQLTTAIRQSRPELDEKPGLVNLVAERVAGRIVQPDRYVSHLDLPGSATGLNLLTAGTGELELRTAGTAAWVRLYTDHRLGDFAEDCAQRWRRAYQVVLIHAPPATTTSATRGIYLAQLPDTLVLTCTTDDDAVASTADLARRTAIARDMLPYDRSKLLVVPVAVGRREPPAAFAGWFAARFAPWYRAWLAPDVPIEGVASALTVDRQRLATEEPATQKPGARLLAALLARGFAGTGLIASSPDAYIGTADLAPFTDLRDDATDVLTDLLEWELELQRWSGVEDRLRMMVEALRTREMRGLTEAVIALELVSPSRRSGDVDSGRTAVPDRVRALVEELLRQLGHPVDKDG